jgi:Tol biopolymer transport system component
MQFHARQANGGTIITYDGKIQKINMKNNKIISAGVYPAWHPTLKLIAYSVNKTGQSFHTRDLNKIEVEDAASDLIVFDLNKNKIMPIETGLEDFSVFPFWAPDGKYLYYCSAHFEYKDTITHEAEAMLRYKEIKYNIYRIPFDEKTYSFGPREIVFDAASMGKSATFPRISPDGRFLMFTLGGWGCFHIWHRDADLWIMDLKTMKYRPMAEINSNNTESYHSWSSNGRWVIFSTRRDDGGYTRPYIAYVDKNGIARKPFELPQDDPDYHHQFMKSYNIPEFMKGPVTIKPQQFADVLKTKMDSTVVVKKLK